MDEKQTPILIELSNAEKLRVSRRRAGITQDAAAALFDVPPSRYKQWELGHKKGAPYLRLSVITQPEWCYVQRRRAGLLLSEVAERSGLAARWIHRAERGEVKDCTPLVEWWRQNPSMERAK